MDTDITAAAAAHSGVAGHGSVQKTAINMTADTELTDEQVVDLFDRYGMVWCGPMTT